MTSTYEINTPQIVEKQQQTKEESFTNIRNAVVVLFLVVAFLDAKFLRIFLVELCEDSERSRDTLPRVR